MQVFEKMKDEMTQLTLSEIVGKPNECHPVAEGKQQLGCETQGVKAEGSEPLSLPLSTPAGNSADQTHQGWRLNVSMSHISIVLSTEFSTNQPSQPFGCLRTLGQSDF